MKHGSRILLFSCLLVISSTSVFCQNTVASSDTDEAHNPYSHLVRNEYIAFTEEEFKHTKNENIFFMGWLDEGWTLMILAFWFDHALFNRWGLYIMLADPEGHEFRTTVELKPEDVSFRSDNFRIKTGNSILEKVGEEYRLQLEINDFGCDLTFTNILPPGNPGDDTVYFREDKEVFQRRIIICPFAEVTGSIDVEGESMPVNGRGYADRTIVVNPLNRLNPQFVSLHVYNDEKIDLRDQWHMHLIDIEAHKAYGSTKMPRLIVAKGGEYLIQTQDYQLELVDFSLLQYRKENYPEKLRIYAESRGHTLEGEYTVKYLFHVSDILSEVPRWLQFIVALFLDMRLYFRCTGEFVGTLTMPDGTVEQLRLNGPYEYVIMK
jgi:hypothetical protein